MRTLVVTLAAVVAFAIAAPVAAPQQQADPNENASCIAHFMEVFGPPGGIRSQLRGPDPERFPFGLAVSHFASVHEGESFEECITEQN